MTAFATAEDWARFLRPIAASVRNVPDAQEFAARAAALAFALRVPVAALTEARQRDLCRRSEFWPSVADVETVFAGAWRDAARSRAIATSGWAPMLAGPATTGPTPEERAALAARARDLAAELRSRMQPSETRRPAARPLSPQQLLALYDHAAQRGDAVCARRAASLRRQLEATAG